MHLGIWPFPRKENVFLTLGDSHNVNIYDLSEARINIPLTVYGGICRPAWSPDGDQFAFSVGYSANYSLMIWDATSGEKIKEILGVSGDSIAWSLIRRLIPVTE